MSDDQLMANPQAFVCMLCPSDKRRCCNSAGALVSHQHRSHGYKNPFRRATVDDSCPACGKTFGTRPKALDHIAYRAKRCRQACLNGSIPWASEEETALADENDRKEAAKLGSQRQVMLPLQVWSQPGNDSWDGCVTWLRRVLVGCVGYCWHSSIRFIFPDMSRLALFTQICLFRRATGHSSS